MSQDVVVFAWTDDFNIIRCIDYGVVVVQFQFVRVDVLNNGAELLFCDRCKGLWYCRSILFSLNLVAS